MKLIEWFKNNFLLVSALLVAAVLRFHNIEYQSVWLDEIHTINESNPKQTLSELYDSLLAADPHPPLYFILVYYLFKIFGYTTLVLKLFSAVVGVIGVFAVYILGKELFNKKVGGYACILITVNYFHLYYSQEARMYGLLFLFTTLSFYYLVRFIKNPTLKHSLLYCLFSTLMIYCHFFALFTVFAQYLILLFFIVKPYKTSSKKLFLLCLLSGVATLILYIPTVGIFLKAAQRTSIWIELPDLDVYTQIFKDFFGQAEIVVFFVVLLFFTFFVHLFKARNTEQFKLDPNKDKLVFSFLILFIWISITLLIPLIRTYTALPMLINRYFSNLIPAVLLVVAIGLLYIRNEIVRYGILSLLVIFSITDIIIVKKYYKAVTKTQYREVTNFIIDNNKNNEPVYTSLGWYFPYFLNNDKVKMTIVDMPLQNHVDEMANDSTKIKPFWYVDTDNRHYTLNAAAQKFLDDNFIVENTIDLFEAWTKHYALISGSVKEMHHPKFEQVTDRMGDEFTYYVDAFEVDSQKVKIGGFACFRNQDATYTEMELILIKEGKMFKIGSQKVKREDVTTYLKSQYDLSNSGFSSKLLMDKLTPGKYQLAILLRNKDTNKEGIVLCDNFIVKN